MGTLKEAIEAIKTIQKAENNVPQENDYQRFFMKPPTVDTYYSDAPGISKHQNTRKSKPRKKVKHGNRKKK